MDVEAIRATVSAYAPGEWLAIGAYIMAGYLAVGLWAAVMSAMLDAIYPQWVTWVWASVKTWLSMALRLFCLVTMGILAIPVMGDALAVALYRLVKIHIRQDARTRWNARTHGRHRYSRVLAWSEGVRTCKGMTS